MAFHLKLPQLQQVILMDHISPGSRGNAFSFVLKVDCPALPPAIPALETLPEETCAGCVGPVAPALG